MSQLSVIAALQCEVVSPKGTQEGEEYLLSSSHLTAAVTPYSEPQESSGCETQDTGLIAEMHTKRVISVSSDSCIFPGCCFVLVWFSHLVLIDSL